MSFSRSSGILLHPTSLPSRFGIGDMGKEAYQFVDFLAASGQSLWQVLPLGPVGYGNSPYQCFSAFAGNTLLISPEKLVEQGLLQPGDLNDVPEFPQERVDFGWVIDYKKRLLEKAYHNFKQSKNEGLRHGFEAFCQNAASWLEDYTLFASLKLTHGGSAWSDWQPELVKREHTALVQFRNQHKELLEAQKFYQFIFFSQWMALKSYCREKGIKIIGDMPIFVAYDSVELWKHPELFKVDKEGKMTVVAGVPPDFFSKTGQLWGNPIYNWDYMRAHGFKWWVERLRVMEQIYDIIRIDHFRGFAACWEVPAGDETAERGKWVVVPGRELFTAVKAKLGDLPIIAEDLGIITPDVVALRKELGFPGMRVLQFAFNSGPDNIHLPHHYEQNQVTYTGTHDNDTTVGWYKAVMEAAAVDPTNSSAVFERDYCLRYLGANAKTINWDLIKAAYASVADIAIVPMQDILGLDSSARMNMPASNEGNWSWRMPPKAVNAKIVHKLHELCETYGRLPKKA